MPSRSVRPDLKKGIAERELLEGRQADVLHCCPVQSAEEASSSGGRPNSATDSREELGPDEVEITDEFGRTRRVSKKSDYYKQYKVGEAVARSTRCLSWVDAR